MFSVNLCGLMKNEDVCMGSGGDFVDFSTLSHSAHTRTNTSIATHKSTLS
jgi:hypothetical protein